MKSQLLPNRKAIIATIILMIVTLVILIAMNRPLICTCGTVEFWHGEVVSAGNSQHITDWYSFSHFTHGLIMYGMAYLLWQKWGLFGGKLKRWSLPIAVFVAAIWEVSENTPMVIDRFRAVTISWGYVGDSIVNSMADIVWMIIGFFVAARIPWQWSVALGLFLELFAAWSVRDNLTINTIMLFWPMEAIREWQGMT